MRVALDAMGGDAAPKECVQGALRALSERPQLQVALVGLEDKIREELDGESYDAERLEIVPATQVVAANERPADALRKKRDSSIVRSFTLVREGGADAVVSAGNTGAVVGAATVLWKLIPGVRRAGIAVALGTQSHHTVLIDVGANIYCKPQHLVHYGLMASVYAERVLGTENPRVALLNIGSEEGKGNELVKETQRLFAEAPFNYVGHAEGNDVFSELADVIVCEGFVGNVVLKVAEGLSERMHRQFDAVMESATFGRENPESVEILREFRRRTDYAEIGGAALLGVNGTCLIAHGRSDRRAISNAVQLAHRFAEAQVVDVIKDGVENARSALHREG
ncbi:MAG TPA: phosphate acyltransferase PlsX [Planctomycetes bacterium]|nr:phosphate acyltransferase PlsX [Planctomycetota bacterium]